VAASGACAADEGLARGLSHSIVFGRPVNVAVIDGFKTKLQELGYIEGSEHGSVMLLENNGAGQAAADERASENFQSNWNIGY
jgi:hypothetical protein